MPDPKKPTGVDYYGADDRFASGTEVGGNPRVVDWLTHADQGVRFAFVKARHGEFLAGIHRPFFILNYPLMKNAGLLRAPYHWLDPCSIQLPANLDTLTSVNWTNAALFPIIGDPIAFVLQQANDFCDLILAEGWGEPGDLPPAVDIEPSAFLTPQGNVVSAVIVDHATGFPILENANGAQIGLVNGQNVVDGAGNQLGQLQNDGGGHPNGFVDAAGVVHPGHLRKDKVTDLWVRIASPQDRINLLVVWLKQVENRLSAAVPNRPAKPIIYSGTTWRELIGFPTDNGGAGFDVMHNGVNFHVDNFQDYLLWFAQYPAPPDGVTRLAHFPTTWATQDRIFIWQYTGDPDRNVLVRITNILPDIGPSMRTVDIEEVNDMTILEVLAGINRPAAAKALTLVSPAPIDAAPARSFNLLLIGQGFDPAEFPAITQRLWADPANLHSISDTAPFGPLLNPSRIACYADDGTGVFLRMRQTPISVAGLDDALAIPADAATLLRDYLPLLKIVAADASETTADKVWLSQRRSTGLTGTLVAILRNGRQPARNPPAALPAQRPAELYQIDPSENYPIPVVAVNVTWNDELWPLVVVRALAQNLSSLRDEVELPGDAFDHPDVGLEQPPIPNLLVLDQPTRDQIAAGGVTPDVAKLAIDTWHLPAGTPLDFIANGAAAGALGGVHLVEGGDGYRHLVMRSDFDCLMRRMPVTLAASVANAVGQPIRANNVPFCRVCREALERAVRGLPQVHAGDSIHLDSQRILYDWISWNKPERPAAGFDPAHAFNRVHTMDVPADEPKWSMTIAYNPAGATIADLFQISSVQLAQRPGDPYAKAIDIIRSLRFSDLSVSYTQRNAPGAALRANVTALNVRDAVTNKLDPPTVELASDGGADRAFQLGVRLRLAWQFSGTWPTIAPRRGEAATHSVRLFTVEVILGLVLTGEQDVDPSFPVRGCRILPQFAMRVRRDSALITTGAPAAAGPAAGRIVAGVSELKGSVVMETVNAIAPDGTLDPSLAAIAMGRLGATLVAGSNTAMGDSKMAPVANNLLLPLSGRKLAGLHVNPKDPAAARWAFVVGPPAWSWRYDYVKSLLAARTAIAGAFRDNEPKGGANPPAVRDLNVTWPAASAFQIGVHKFFRQGDYDALYIHPIDATATPTLQIPMSGDLGLVLNMRQGASESAVASNLPLLGWGPGRLDSGAHTSVGAPLIPPNQHVDLTVETPAQGVVRVTYGAVAQEFRHNDWQVFLEQGLALGYRFDVRNPGGLQWLRMVAAMAGVPAATMQALNAALADAAHPANLDIVVRGLFRTLHAGARLYDAQVDGTNVQQAPESADAPGAEAL